MKHLFVPYEIAKQLKEKGFDERCFTEYTQSPLPPYKWTIHSLNSISLHAKEEQGDSFKLDFTGYRNSSPPKFGIEFVAAPLYQQVIDWFRDNHNIHFEVQKAMTPKDTYLVVLRAHYTKTGNKIIKTALFPYYEALTKAIEEALKLI